MPASMSAAEPTPSPSAKQASLTSWTTIRSSTGSSASASTGGSVVARRPGRVLVPAAAALAPEPPAGDEPGDERRRAPARLAEGLLVERLRDREADVEPDQVHQLERAHAEAAAAHRAVDLLGRGDPLLHDPQPLERERPVAAVDDEAGAVGGVDHVLAHRLAGGTGRGEGVGAAVVAGDHLEQPHLLRRVEEVHADDALVARGQRGDAQRRGVRGQHAVARHDPAPARRTALS